MESNTDLESAFYRPFIDREAVENRLIGFDLDNIKSLAVSNHEEVGKILHSHYTESMKIVQLGYGQKEYSFDFQHYNWGLCLCSQETATERDKLSLLFSYYGKCVRNRLSLSEFEVVIKRHTDFNDLERHQKKIKWDDLLASFKLHAKPKDKHPDTVGLRHMEILLEVNKIAVRLDLTRIINNIKKQDRTGRSLLAMLDDDPVLKGQSKIIALSM